MSEQKPKRNWDEYIEKTKNKAPNKLLVEALPFVEVKNEALDLGSGAFADTKFLISEGFGHVIAVDLPNEKAKRLYSKLPKEKIEYVASSFEDFQFPKNTFDLTNAQFSLPFNPPDTFSEVFDRLKKSLKVGGIFTGQFFGKRDQWNQENSNMSFHSKEEIETLLSGMDVLTFKEEEVDEKPRVGDYIKHWHIFHIIARKK